MRKSNRIISVAVAVCFIFNTILSDLALGQPLNLQADSHKLAPPSQCDDIMGIEGIQPKDISDIRIWFIACLEVMKKRGLPITVENLQKFHHLPGNTIFNPQGAQFFINEAKTLEDGTIQIKVGRSAKRYRMRAYYAEG